MRGLIHPSFPLRDRLQRPLNFAKQAPALSLGVVSNRDLKRAAHTVTYAMRVTNRLRSNYCLRAI
jgi:hypothetical protein